MKFFHRAACAAGLSLALAGASLAQVQAPAAAAEDGPPPAQTALTRELFLQLLLGELMARGDEPATGYSMIMEAARRTNDPELYQRAVQLALQFRSGDLALQAARAWRDAQPQSRDANRFVLQLLVALNRPADSIEALQRDLAIVDAKDRNAALLMLPQLYARVSDKKGAATLIERALADYGARTETAGAAWTAIGRLRLQAGDSAGAIDAARRGQEGNPASEAPVVLALELMDPKLPQAEPIVLRYLEGRQPMPEVRMGYARALLDAQRYAEASRQLQFITTEKPDFAEAWLARGVLLVQDNQLAPAETALLRYIELARTQAGGQERNRGLAQAYLSLAQVAEKRRDFTAAGAWLDRIDDAQDLVSTQNRRASILARQGRLDEARDLLRKLPERTPADARVKLMAEVQLLRDNKQFRPAYQLLAQASAKDPRDNDLLYEQAMMAEKVGELVEMERLLRQLIAAKPDYHHAYNALGYSLADRNVRLPEAKQLIQKALEYAPNDPYISDSLGWVEFRMGNKAEALRILDTAYRNRPDAEIAAHLGEVLWSLGQRTRAQTIWKEGLLINSENETLQETLKRLRVSL